jgi:UDP-N-acetylmuramate dehydrogenase
MPFEKLKKRFPNLKKNEPLKNHCTFRVGGLADYFYELTNIEELPKIITAAEENGVPYKIIGRGSNVLFTDKGFRGLLIKNLSKSREIHGDEIAADSGVILAEIVRLSVENDLNGLELLFGVPGTFGGAIYGNAGVPGTEIGQFVKTVTVFNPADGVCEKCANEIAFGYRHTSLQENGEIILRATIKLKKGVKEKSKELIKKINEIRTGKQPIGYSAGSFFKNPSKDQPAGLLIDQCGLKGTRIGDAEISLKHGNFLLNKGNATANQILELANIAIQKVKEKFGVNLQMEVKIIGDL